MKLFTGIIFFVSIVAFGQGTGLKMDIEKYRKIPMAKKELGYGNSLPSKVSLKNYVPSIKNQGDFGTCVGWSSTYYLATMEYAILNDLTDQYEIDKNAFDPYYTYLKITSDDDYFLCDAGSTIEDACHQLYSEGVKRFGYNELTCGSHISNNNERKNSLIEFTDYFRLIDEENSNEENINAIKQALSDKHPVLIGMVLTNTIYDVEEDGVYSTEDSYYAVGGHAMTVIGYDDDLNGGSFEIVNSWGDDWGNDGYLTMKYDEFIEYTPFAYSLESEINETVGSVGCVYGNCSEGYGRYIYKSGDVYEGDFINGERNGYGIYFWTDQSHHQGEWESNLRHGKGAYIEKNYVFSGYWHEDDYNQDNPISNTYTKADRITTLLNNQLFRASTNEIFAIVRSEGFRDSISELEKSECIFGDCENGLGVFYEGEGENNYIEIGFYSGHSINGYSEVYWTGKNKGHVYKGERVNHKRDGYGAYFYPNRNKYFGEWKEGVRDGEGTLFKRSGEILAGEWEDGSFQGDELGFGGNVEKKPLNIEASRSKNIKEMRNKSTSND